MVAVAHERPYAGLVQPFQAIDELELRAQAPVGSVVNVPSDQQRVYTFFDAQVDDVLVGAERRIAQRARHIVGSDGLYADKWAIEMQISGMYEAEMSHVYHQTPNGWKNIDNRSMQCLRAMKVAKPARLMFVKSHRKNQSRLIELPHSRSSPANSRVTCSSTISTSLRAPSRSIGSASGPTP